MGSDLGKKKVGFFGGTFDPIHNGHLSLAIQIKEQKFLDEIIFCPANISPFKDLSPPVEDVHHRVAMVELAIQGLKGFQLSTIEINKPSPSYTIDTIEELIQKEGKEKDFFLLLADDVILTIEKWKDWKRLLELAPPLIGTRHATLSPQEITLPESIQSILEKGRCKICAMDMSSTLIRERIKKGLYCDPWLRKEVMDYIYQNRLYCS